MARARRRSTLIPEGAAGRRDSAAPDDGPDAVVCLLCGKRYRAVNFAHLRRTHGFRSEHPVEEYKSRFSLSVACCRATRRSMRRVREDYWARQGRRWPRERVLAELRRRVAAGKSVASSRLGVGLQLAIRRRFGSWERAMRRAGLDPAEHRLTRRWTKRQVVEALRRLHAEGSRIDALHVARSDPALLKAAYRILGNWGQTLRAAGFDPAAHRAPRKWSLEAARDWVRTRLAAGRPIAAKHVPRGLYGRVSREGPGGWGAFVQSMGIPDPGPRRRRGWTDAAVLEAIRARRRRGLPLHRDGVAAESQALTHQARQRFGSWDAALEAAGLDPTRVRLAVPRWTRRGLETAILDRHRTGRSLERRVALSEARPLVKGAERWYGSWGRALVAVGLPRALARGGGSGPA
jgi:hypothetical protein